MPGMSIAAHASNQRDTTAAFHEAFDAVSSELGTTPSLLVAYVTSSHDPEQIVAAARSRAPGVPLHGATSCQGVITHQGHFGAEGLGLGLLAIADPRGRYGVGSAPLETDPRSAGRQALLAALARAGRPGEAPNLVWLSTAPGSEERVLDGMHEVFGRNVPIIGGSAADDTISGTWRQFTDASVHREAVVATVMFPGSWLGYAYRSGYTPTTHSGRVTRAEGRTVFTIEGKPAAHVYDQWTDGVLGWEPGQKRAVLGTTILLPLGRVTDTVQGVPYFLLAHPHAANEDGSLAFLADMREGEELHLMRGSCEALLQRAGRVAEAAIQSADGAGRSISGALIVYCAGSMLAIRPDLEQVVEGLRSSLGARPFLGTFSFGEQGCFRPGGNRHGNLMVSAVVFGSDPQ